MAQLHTSLHPAALLSLSLLLSQAANQNQLSRTWLPGCVLSGRRFGVKCLCAGLGLKDSVPRGAFPSLYIGNRPAVLCRRWHFPGGMVPNWDINSCYWLCKTVTCTRIRCLVPAENYWKTTEIVSQSQNTVDCLCPFLDKAEAICPIVLKNVRLCLSIRQIKVLGHFFWEKQNN